jgi:hypothetical protein
VATHESDRLCLYVDPRTGVPVLDLAATVLLGGVLVKAYCPVGFIARGLAWEGMVILGMIERGLGFIYQR